MSQTVAAMPAAITTTAGNTRFKIGIASERPAEPNKSNGAFSTGVIIRRVFVSSLEFVAFGSFVALAIFAGAEI